MRPFLLFLESAALLCFAFADRSGTSLLPIANKDNRKAGGMLRKAPVKPTPINDRNTGSDSSASAETVSTSRGLLRTKQGSTIDLCSNDTLNFCHTKADCILNPTSPTMRGYDCICHTGYTGDGIWTCENLDECSSDYPCAPEGGFCVDRDPDSSDAPSMYKCGCRQGFELPLNGNFNEHGPLECVPIDYCERAGDHGCNLENATCINTASGFYCECKEGYTGDGKVCMGDSTVEDKEKKYVSDPCDSCDPAREVCSPDQTSCICADGFFSPSGAGGFCQDRQECSVAGANDCDINAECQNLEGGYLCFCNTGFTGNGKACTNIDECSLGTHNCGLNSDCVDTEGSYACVCSSGYDGDPFTACIDENECELGSHTCDAEQGVCANTPGSYNCSCEVGYEISEGSDNACFDQNECSLGLSDCDSGEICVNSPGSYACVVPPRPSSTNPATDPNCGLQDEPSPFTGISTWHNDIRLAVSAATTLPCLKWNTALARLADTWVQQCDLNGPHDDSALLTMFPSGYGSTPTAAGTSVFNWQELADRAWNSQVRNYNVTDNTCTSPGACDSYKQIVWENTTDIGCGFHVCANIPSFPVPNAVIFMCYYGPSDVAGGGRPYVLP